jgi:cytochrome c553
MALVYATIAGAAAEPAAKPDVERGRQIASTVCAACHGADGNSAIPANPRLAEIFPGATVQLFSSLRREGVEEAASALSALAAGKNKAPAKGE